MSASLATLPICPPVEDAPASESICTLCGCAWEACEAARTCARHELKDASCWALWLLQGTLGELSYEERQREARMVANLLPRPLRQPLGAIARRTPAVVALLLIILGSTPAWAGTAPTSPPPLAAQDLGAAVTGWWARVYRCASDALQELAAGSPQRGGWLTAKGQAALGLGRAQEAEQLGRAALEQPLHPAAALVLLGDALRLQGRCAAARPYYAEVLISYPDDRGALQGQRLCAVAPVAQVRQAVRP